MKARGLRGRTVIITRPRRQAGALVARLEAAGARAVQAPLIRICDPVSYRALDRALRALSSFDCAVFASANAARRFFARARALRLGRLRRPGRVFAVGPETARAVRSLGWRPQPLPKSFDAGRLARGMKRVRGIRILIPRAAAAREELPRRLRRRGATVLCVQAYRTTADSAGAARLRAAARGRVDAVVFTSPSTVERFVAALGAAEARRLLSRGAPVSIGSVTSAALRRRGFAPVQARQASAAALVDALAEHFSR